MIKKIEALCVKYREQLLYLIFGGLTTVVDWGICFAGYRLFAEQMQTHWVTVHIIDTVAWVAAVLFAFFTNRILVFRSRKRGLLPVLGELGTFAGGRVVTLLAQEAIMAVFVTALGLSEYVFKVVAAVIVVIANYFISKLIVFRKGKHGSADGTSGTENPAKTHTDQTEK